MKLDAGCVGPAVALCSGDSGVEVGYLDSSQFRDIARPRRAQPYGRGGLRPLAALRLLNNAPALPASASALPGTTDPHAQLHASFTPAS